MAVSPKASGKRSTKRAAIAQPSGSSIFQNPQPWIGAAIIILLTFLAYIPAFGAGYVWDDSDHVTQVPFQRTLTALKWVWFKLGATPQYYPLTHTVFWIEYHLWGMQAGGYHAVNIVLHITCALLVWRVTKMLDIGGAWLVAAIFAVHPVHVESVAWITELKNTLSGCFYLSSLWAALRAFSLASKTTTRPEPPRVPRLAYAVCLLLFVAAVLSKTITCTLPAVLVLILWWKHGRLIKRDYWMLAPMFAIALAAAKLTSGMEQWNVGARGPDFAFTFDQRVLIAGRAAWFYFGKLLWPHPLIFIYPRWQVDSGAIWQWIFPAGAVVVVGALWLLRNRIGRGPLVAVLFFLGTLFPALGLVDVYPMRFSFVADHFQYLASIGMIILVVEVMRNCVTPSRYLYPICAALLLLLASLSFLQARPYRNAATLWLDTLAKNPACWLAMDDLGADAVQHGDNASALAWYDRSLTAHPNQLEAHLGRAGILARCQPPRFDEAKRELEIAGDMVGSDVRPIHQMAELLAEQGNFPAAEAAYLKALSMQPTLEPARLEYANLLRMTNRLAEAEVQYRKAIELNPDSFQARAGLAAIRYVGGDIPTALTLMSEAIDINPTDPTFFTNYGVFLMAAQSPAEAADAFKNAIVLDPGAAIAFDGLGNALLAQGKPRDAAAMFRKALELKPDFEPARQHLAPMGITK